MDTIYEIEFHQTDMRDSDHEFRTEARAIEWANQALADYCLDHEVRYSQVNASVVMKRWHDDEGEFIEVSRDIITITYDSAGY